MTHVYKGCGPAEYARRDIYQFINAIPIDSLSNPQISWDTERTALSTILPDLTEDSFSEEDLLVGYEYTVKWMNDSNQPFGGYAISIPRVDATEQESVEALPGIAEVFSQKVFMNFNFENPSEHTAHGEELLDGGYISENDAGETTINTNPRKSYIVEHDQTGIQLAWYAKVGETFTTYYCGIHNPDETRIFRVNSLVIDSVVPQENVSTPEFDADIELLGGYDADTFDESVTRYNAPIFDDDFTIQSDEGIIIRGGQESVFEYYGADVLIRAGHSEFHEYFPPEDGQPITTDVSNAWDDVFYYVDGGAKDIVYGRIDYPSGEFMTVRIVGETGFVGSDEYFMLVRDLGELKPSEVAFESVIDQFELD